MELGQYQLQIFVSLVVILGAAFVALICDFLKGNNEQLRELTVELKVRREEEQRRGQVMTPRTAAARVAIAPETAAPPTQAVATAVESTPERKRSVFTQNAGGAQRRQASADALAAMERGARLAGASKTTSAPSASPAARTNSQPPPLPTQDPKRAIALLAAASPAITIKNAPAYSAPVPAVMIERPVLMEQVVIDEPVAIETPVIEQMIAQEPTRVAPEATSAPKKNAPPKKDWGALLARRASASVPAAVSEPVDAADTAIEQRTTANPLGDIPAGFHDGVVLTRLILARQPVTGLVVSIGVTSNRKNGTVPEPVNGLIRSLIGADNFACSTGTDEFLLIYPRLNGAAAQRQLSLVAQHLWDFQLRSLGSTSILFSWGGVQVASESIDEAVASANERMNETRRNRKLVAMPLRQAI